MDEKLQQSLQKLIEYQKKDIELRKLRSLLARDEARVSMAKHERAFNDAKQAISECEQTASALIAQYRELIKYVDDNEAAFGEMENIEALSEEELAERVKRLESFKSKFQQADKKAGDINDRSKEVCRTRSDALKSGNIAKQKYGEAKAKHTELLNSKADELNRLRSELEALRVGLDEALFAEYQKLVEESKFPPVVPASGDDKRGMFSCGGCGLNLPQQGNSQLKDQGVCRCDNCHRIIYKIK